ncbi:MAG: hypothetical protein KGK30_07785, partial [Elusimicrobia bacterium]|nr:hypothetical protein [Elusimicrobiota bacterium]
MTYRVWRVGRSSAAAEVELPVEIKPVVRLEVSLQSAPSFVPAGTGYQALFLVANRGNVAQTARVELQSGDSFPAQPDVERFSLPPGQSRVVTVLVRTDPKLPRALLHRLRLRLLAAGSVAQAYCQVRVVPIVSQTEDPYRRLQSRAGVEGGGEQGRSALQFNWSGGGFLDAAGGRWLDFRLQQPMDQSLTLFGFRQELAASYRWKGGESQVGDAGYTLSPLTQLYEFGRGARAQAALGPLRVGGFAMETRGRPTVEHRQAAFVAFNPGGKPLRLRANWLKKGPGGGDEIGSVQAELGPAAGLGLNLEYAAGRSPLRKAPPSQQAWNARLEGRAWGRYPMLAEKIHAGRDFNGYYSDADLTRLQLGAPLGARLGVDLSFYKDVFNLDADPARSAAPWQQRATASLRWARTPRMSWDLSFEDERSKDRLPGSSMDLGARQASLGLTRLFGSLSARLTGSMNWIDDLAAAHAYDYGGAGINLSYLARRAQSYSAFAELGPQGLAVDSPRELVVGAGADVTPLSGLVVDAQLERRDPGAAGPASLRYLASIHWRFFGSESLSLRA